MALFRHALSFFDEHSGKSRNTFLLTYETKFFSCVGFFGIIFLLDLNHFDNVIELMIEKEVGAVFYGRMDKIGKYFRDKLTLDWLEDDRIIKASLIRNCIVHNSAVADRRLAEASTLKVGDAIPLSDEDVHDFGLVGRQLCRQLYADAEKKFLSTAGEQPGT